MIEDRIRSEEWNVVELSNALKITCVRLEVHKHKHGPYIMHDMHSQFRLNKSLKPLMIKPSVRNCPSMSY